MKNYELVFVYFKTRTYFSWLNPVNVKALEEHYVIDNGTEILNSLPSLHVTSDLESF